MLYAVATTLLTHGEARYRQFLFPVLIPYAAWMLVKVIGDRGQGIGDRGQEAGGRRQAAGGRRQETKQSEATPATRHPPLVTRHSSPVTRHPSPVTRHLAIALLWLLIGGVWLGFYPREWASQNLLRGWHALSSELAWAAGWHDAALRADARALAAQESPDGWIRLGDHERALGDTSRARKAYREAVALTPPYLAAVARLGDLLRSQGDREAAQAFVGDYVDQQRLVEWSWRDLTPGPRSYVNVGDGLDFGYVGGVYVAEKQAGVLARWSDGRAVVRLPGAGPGVLRLRLAAPRPDGSSTRAEVCAAGRCQALVVGPGWRTYELPLVKRLAATDQIELSSDTFQASEGRRLGVLIDWVDVR
jgi:hypothetical protein